MGQETSKILVVDDDMRLRSLLERYLVEQGYQVRSAANAEQMDRLLERENFHLMVLDLMLPGEDGLSICRRLRQANNELPIIMLTAKGESEDMVKGLSVGADDYINKPFSPPELIARIKAVLRRCRPMEDDDAQKLQMGEMVMDTKSHRVSVNGERIELGPTEFRLLHFFMKNPERAYNRSQLLDFVWGDTVYIEERTVDVHIRRLRKALEPSGHDNLVQTVRGVGYRFSAE